MRRAASQQGRVAWHTLGLAQDGYPLDKISSRIFITLRYRDEDPIVEKPCAVIIANYASVTIISNQRKTYTYWKTLALSIRIQKKSHFAKNMCKCIFDRIHWFTTTLAAFKSKTGRIGQPITDAADATSLRFATHPLTSSYNNYYYYVTLMVKLYGCHL